MSFLCTGPAKKYSQTVYVRQPICRTKYLSNWSLTATRSSHTQSKKSGQTASMTLKITLITNMNCVLRKKNFILQEISSSITLCTVFTNKLYMLPSSFANKQKTQIYNVRGIDDDSISLQRSKRETIGRFNDNKAIFHSNAFANNKKHSIVKGGEDSRGVPRASARSATGVDLVLFDTHTHTHTTPG